jgi:hypothetical protein
MSELFRAQQGVKKICHGENGDGKHNDGLERHFCASLDTIAELHVTDREQEECQ